MSGHHTSPTTMRIRTIIAAFVVMLCSSAALTARSLTILYPNGGETFTAGTPITVRWSESGLDDDDELEVEYTVDGDNWRRVARLDAGTGSVSWTPDRAGTSARVRVSMRREESVTDMSDADFTIAEDPAEATILVAPNGGETWRVGEPRTISWQVPADAIDVLLELSTNGGASWSTIATLPATMTQYRWTVPSLSPEDITLAIVRVSVAEAVDHFDVSDAPFTIRPHARITVIAPNGGERFAADAATVVRWSASGMSGDGPDVRAEYSIDSGRTWSGIATEDATDGFHAWVVPNTPTRHALVRVMTLDGAMGDTSDAVFEIAGDSVVTPPPPTRADSIVATAPSAGDVWIEGEYRSVTWTTSAADDDVAISALVRVSGSPIETVVPIRTVPAANAAITWIVPRFDATEVSVRLALQLVRAGIADTTASFIVRRKRTVAEIERGEEASIPRFYSDPAGALIDVRISEVRSGSVGLFTTGGELVATAALVDGRATIPVEGIAAGSYLLDVRADRDTTTRARRWTGTVVVR